ncbi:hypothetical protein ACIRVK_41235 [Streptomyces sp. NPDC101152]|uniref:hypothetical protein n=1 Tax=Streptomyces sp. NPDC101152 TaxID=3366116 RepID=UPI0038096E64
MSAPTLKALSLSAGVQSTCLLLMAAEGHLPGLVYDHLDRIEREIAEPAGIPVLRVSSGNIRSDALGPSKRFASMPLHILNSTGSEGMSRRQCTGQYKIRPIKEKVRELLGHPYPRRIPAGVHVEQWIGISVDEFTRAKDADVAYMNNRFPLIEHGSSRSDCLRLLRSRGFGQTPKSACLGCPYHGNAQWRSLRNGSPQGGATSWSSMLRSGRATRGRPRRARRCSGRRICTAVAGLSTGR